METQSRGRHAGTLAVALVLALLLGVTVIYYNAQLSQSNNSSNSAIRSLQSQITGLQSSIAVLKAQSQSSNQGGTAGSSSNGTEAQSIFSGAANSVLMIEGDVATTVQTFFGPRTTYSTVLGSGFVITYQGVDYVVTNFHVVDGMANMTVTFSNGDSYIGKVVGTDRYSDLAVVSVNAPSSEFSPLAIVDSAGVQVGQSVFAIGSPFGLSGTFTSGVISALGRTIQESTAGSYSISGVIQFSAPINPGNSGGPLLDSAGRVIGITTATVSGSQGLEFAIPSRTILKELSSLTAIGTYADHSYLGITGADMNFQLAQLSGTNVTYGVLVENVVTGSPADKAGLRAGTNSVTVYSDVFYVGGDIIVSVNGTRIVNQDALSSYLEQTTVSGQNIELGIIRSGSLTSVTVTLGTRP
jgi:S1-C subfamily serine protease